MVKFTAATSLDETSTGGIYVRHNWLNRCADVDPRHTLEEQARRENNLSSD
jgi:hypothetical protein